MKLKAIYLIPTIALLISQSIFTDYSSKDETVEFINYMSEKHGYNKTYLTSIFKNAEYQDKVVRIMNKQPEGTMTWERYRAVSYTHLTLPTILLV